MWSPLAAFSTRTGPTPTGIFTSLPIGQLQPWQYYKYDKVTASGACVGTVFAMIARLTGDKYPLLTVPYPPPSNVSLWQANIDFFLDTKGFATWANVKPILNQVNPSPVAFKPSLTPNDPYSPPVQSQYTKLGGSADQDVLTQLAAGHLVVIHGTQNAKPSPPNFGHTMLATGVIRDPSTNMARGIMANDPELGQQVIIGWDPSNHA